MGTIRGVDAKVYLNVEVTDAYANPDWEFWDTVNAAMNIDFTEADTSSRGGAGFKTSAATLTAIEVSGAAIVDKDDAVFVAMKAAALAKSQVDVMVLDSDIADADADGVRFFGEFISWNESQELEDVIRIEWTLKPARNAHAPEWIAGGV